MRKNVLDAHADLDLQVFAVWLPVLGSDNREAAMKAATILADPRVAQFYDPGAKVGRWYKTHVVDGVEHLREKRVFRGGITWDAFFLYGADATWVDAPQPHLTTGATVMDENVRLAKAITELVETE